MRLIYTTDNQKYASGFASCLTELEIEYRQELKTTPENTLSYTLWIVEEDKLEKALEALDTFLKDPEAEKFYQNIPKLPKAPPLAPFKPIFKTLKEMPEKIPQKLPRRSATPLTTYLLMICTLLFISAQISAPHVRLPQNLSLPATPILEPYIYKSLRYDYPHAFDLVDQVISAYGIEKTLTPSELPQEGKILLRKFYHTPYWQGIYTQLVTKLKDPSSQWNFSAPLFEKEREGEIWRLFTPCLLHANLMHILFNMIWLLVLGRQIEMRLGPWRYIFFLLFVGIFSNTAQYLMSGSNFLGISGILTGMMAFTYIRQKNAPWENYPLPQSTLRFIAFFIFALFTLQILSFSLEVFNDQTLFLGIANTAHISGLIAGYIIAQINPLAKAR